MAKKVHMIAPFDALSGNLSGKQNLKYAKNDNSAYEAPVGKVNYARNYKPRYIAAVRSSDGRAYYSVRTRNGVNLSSSAKHTMAVYGGTFALIGSLYAQGETTVNSFGAYYLNAVSRGQFEGTFRQYLTEKISQVLRAKQERVVFSDPDLPGTKYIYNPWVATSYTSDITVSNETLKKFWDELATNPIIFKIGTVYGVAHNGDTFAQLISSGYNVLGLTTETIGSTLYVKMGNEYLQLLDLTVTPPDAIYCESVHTIYPTSAVNAYQLTDVAPEP